MTFLLASAPHADTFGYSMPPPGLLRLGGELRRRGLPVGLDDLAFALARGELPGDAELARACADRLLARKPAVVGLSVMGATLPIALAIADQLRRRAPQVPVWLGGPGVTGVDVALIERFSAVGLVARGEGERTLPELLGRLAEGAGPAGVAGVTWRAADGRAVREPDRPPLADLDEVAPYAWDLLPSIAEYKALTGEDEGLVPIDSGRGCVYDCSFCTIGRYWNRRSRTLPAPRLAEEIAALAAIPGARNAYLCHDIFGADRRHALELCRLLEERDAGVPWEVRARIDHLDDELVGAMASAGCYRVLLGVESADGSVRNRNGKRMEEGFDVVERVGRLGDAGITPILSLILGLPGEGEAELRATCELALACSLRTGAQLSFHLVNPQPGCGLGEQQGARSRPVVGIPPDMALGAGLTEPERELIEAHPDLFSTWALLTDLPGGVEHLRRLHALSQGLPPLLMRYPRSFALVARRRGLDALDLFDHLVATGRSFESLARSERDALVDDCLAWEQAQLRAAVLIAGDGQRSCGAPRPAGVLLRARHDLAALAGALRAGGPIDPVTRACDYLVAADERGTRTLAVSADVADLLGELDGRDVEALEAQRAGFGRALEALAAKGLVRLPTNIDAALATSSETGRPKSNR
ncbi:B12-binding domain-containing radical SAM protein [Engelhardtia mirabilis]|uniref:Coproporphyrinogen III oxidase n=1 Tax=Engelhardtia mirabilis TaxID=2528011 RepID=A0A518BNB1_9BACT|nr:coproporphyrinogen III oxidase [Planctomycetes bacterium Pla133]QDV02794.1 coproporphyrinogen III oxidase [Planctomycetes bacterium Pla86]